MLSPVFKFLHQYKPVSTGRSIDFLFALIISSALLVAVSGCQYTSSLSTAEPAGSSPASDNPAKPALDGVLLGKSADRARVARDLVSALRQIDGLQPEATGIAMQTPSEPFAQSLNQALLDARYDMKVEDAPVGDNVISYEIKPATSNSEAITIIVSVDRMKIKRDYTRKDGWTKPDSSLFVLGADPDNIILDSAIFEQPAPGTRIQTAAAAGTAFDSVSLPAMIEVSPEARGGVSTRDTAPATSFAISASKNLKRKRNIYELGQSNFLEVLKSYQDIDTRVLVFSNDSMRLGSGNKWFVKTMSKKFDPVTDAFSVIGCSFGYTKINNGNALLALGRAHRVKEELLRNGIPEENILDEGCWSGGENDKDLPSRGVLLVLKRRA